MLPSPVSLMLFLLMVSLIHVDDAFGAQTENRKLKETINARRNLNGDDNRSSKMEMGPSKSIRCGGWKTLKNMATTNYHPAHHGPIPGGYLSSLCQPCSSNFPICVTFTCTTTQTCQSTNGSPPTCTSSENCVPASGN